MRSARIILAGLLACALGQAHALPLRLTVVLSEPSGAYQEFSNSLSRKLSGQEVILSVQDASLPLPPTDLVVAVGMRASSGMLQASPVPVLSVLVPREGYNQLLKDHAAKAKPESKTHSAIYLDQPPARQFALVASLLPGTRSVGVLYSAPPRDIGMLRAQAGTRKFELYERQVASTAVLPQALQELLVSSDVLLALPDAEIYNSSTIRNILLATYRNRVPLIGFSAGYVKAGALAAVYSTPEQIAQQAAAMVQEFASGAGMQQAQYAREFEVSVNEQVARSLGLNIKSAAQLQGEVGKIQ